MVAMKAKEEYKLTTLWMVKSALKNKEIDKREKLMDAEESQRRVAAGEHAAAPEIGCAAGAICFNRPGSGTRPASFPVLFVGVAH